MSGVYCHGKDKYPEMALGQFGHLMHYWDRAIRKTVPLALGRLSATNASNPQIRFLTLSLDIRTTMVMVLR